ncbi:MAG TPA: hypothetical protein VL128_13930 [Candidatus Eisenbacteria bacterium]|nr:hypothetical protein [Candidatus Eisenbacteria bacterium]
MVGGRDRARTGDLLVANSDGVECVRCADGRCRVSGSFSAAELEVGLVYVTFELRGGTVKTVAVDVSVDAIVAEKIASQRERK